MAGFRCSAMQNVVSRSNAKLPLASRPFTGACRKIVTRAGLGSSAEVVVDRRDALLSIAALLSAPVLLSSEPALAVGPPAETGPYTTFLGMASPPTSYGGYGGNANEAPKYSFEYPTGWKKEQPNKVEKGTQGVDGRVVNPKSKGEKAFVITLGRAGEDNKSFKITDTDSTFAGFAGADYDLQDSLSNASNITKKSVERDGNTFYEFDIEAPEFRYLSSITVKQGKVFALFVRSPTKAFDKSEEKLRHIVDTFTLL